MKFTILFVFFLCYVTFSNGLDARLRRKVFRTNPNLLHETRGRVAPFALATTVITSDRGDFQKIFAKVVGYIIGAGALGLYTPIIFDLLKRSLI